MPSEKETARRAVMAAMALSAAFAVGCSSTPFYEAPDDIGNQPIEAPFELVAGGLPVVAMEVGGKRLRLIVDTGADRVSLGIKPSALEGADVLYDGRSRKSRDINGVESVERSFAVPSVRIGGWELRDVPGSEELRDFVPADGIIGNAFLSAFDLVVDYPGSRIRLYRRGSGIPELASGTWGELRFKRGFAGLTVACAWSGGGRGRFCLDTGASGRGILHAGKTRLSEITGEVEVAAAMDGRMPLATLRGFSLGGVPVGDLEFAVRDLSSIGPFGPPFAGIVGYEALEGRRVVFDFSRGVIFLETDRDPDRAG